MALLAWWYPDTYELNRIFPNLDHIFATWEQSLFGCQPALLFSKAVPSYIFSELFDMGYAAYYPMIFLVVFYYYLCRYHEFDDSHVLNLYFDLDKMSYLNYIDGKLERIDEPIDIETLIKNLEDTNTGCLASGIYDLCDELYGDVYDEK